MTIKVFLVTAPSIWKTVASLSPKRRC